MRVGRLPLQQILIAWIALTFVSGVSVAAAASAPQEPEQIHIEAAAPAAESSPEAAEGGGLPARKFDDQRFRSRLEAHWFRRKALLERNDGAGAAQELAALEALCGEMGIATVPSLGAALVHEGDGFLREGNFNKARDAYAGALKLSPDLPQAYAGLARSAWKSGGSTGTAAGQGARALLAAFRESWRTFRSLGNGILIALIAGGAALVVFAGLLALRYQAAARHDIEEQLSGRLGPSGAAAAGWIVLLAPLLTVVLAPLTPVWWIVLHGRHAGGAERTVAAILLAGLALSGPAGIMALTACRIASDPVARELMDASGKVTHPESILALEELSKNDPDDALYPSLLGDLYARGHFLQEAMARYGRAAEIAPSDPRPWNNIGNLYFQAGRHGEAATAYKKALDLDGRFLPAWVNLYLAEQKMFDFHQAEDALQKGRDVNARAVAALLETRGAPGTAAETAPSEVERREVWNRILARGPWTGSATTLAVAGLKTFFSLAGIGGLLLFFASLALGGEPARTCTHCGQPFCDQCQGAGEGDDACAPCRHLTMRGASIPVETRRSRLEAIERRAVSSARLARWMSLALPGSGDFLAGRTVRAALLSATWCLGLATIALHGRLLQAPVPEPWPWAILVPAGLLAALTWSVANRPVRA